VASCPLASCGTHVSIRRSWGVVSASYKQPIDAVTAADSVIALLGSLDTERFPRSERIAVARLQAAAIRLRLDWVAKLCQTLSMDVRDSGTQSIAGSETGSKGGVQATLTTSLDPARAIFARLLSLCSKTASRPVRRAMRT
jgi:hypothetical protein